MCWNTAQTPLGKLRNSIIGIMALLILFSIVSACVSGSLGVVHNVARVARTVVVSSTRQPPVRELPPVATHALLLDTNAFPAGWIRSVVESDPEYDLTALEATYAQFQHGPEEHDFAVQIILWYGTLTAAQDAFSAQLKHDQESGFDWQPRPELRLDDSTQPTSLHCLTLHGPPRVPVQRCKLMSQYGSYISIFVAPLDVHDLDDARFRQLRTRIDQQMAPVVNK